MERKTWADFKNWRKTDASVPLQISGNIFLQHLSPLASLKSSLASFSCTEIASKTLFKDDPIEGEEAVPSKICLHIK